MPKRKTADVTAEAPIAAEPRTKAATTAKPKSAAAATHKRTSTTRKSQVVAEVAAAEPVASAPSVHPPTHGEIAALAYSYWEARGFATGSPDDDWFRAERELTRPE